MPRDKKRATAKLIRYAGAPTVFYIQLESPDDGTTPGSMLFDDKGNLRQFTLVEGRAWLLCYLFGGTPKECEKKLKEAAKLEAKQLAAAQSQDPKELKRRIARAEAELKILEEERREG